MKFPFLSIAFLMLFAAALGPGEANAQLSELSMEELGATPVVQAAKKSKSLFDAPADAFVFDGNAIDRLPVDSIPEMLRYAPGTHIIRQSNGIWGIGIRGMNSRFLSRALFRVDDLSIYGSLFAGLFGAEHDLLLEDVASIEVVPGPGGGLWGSNSANGRVNVVMKTAFETEGGVLKLRYGTQNRSVAGRYGWRINDNASARIYVKGSDRRAADSEIFEDDWDSSRAGIQLDTRPSAADLFTLSAEAYGSRLGYARPSFDFSTGESGLYRGKEVHEGYNVQGKWMRQVDSESGLAVRTWAGENHFRPHRMRVAGAEFKGRARTTPNQRFHVTLGGSRETEVLYDYDLVVFRPNDSSVYDPVRKGWVHEDNNGFGYGGAEYVFELFDQSLDLSLGGSAHYDSYAGSVNWQPSMRALYRMSEKDRVWLSYSESTRSVPPMLNDAERITYGSMAMTPVEIPTPDGDITVAQQALVGHVGESLKNEHMKSYQLGYRKQTDDGASFSISAFYSHYDDMLGFTEGRHPPFPVLDVANPYFEVEAYKDNVTWGESFGGEFSAKGKLNDWLEATLNYSYIDSSFSPKLVPESFLDEMPILATELSSHESNGPRNMATVWLSADLHERWKADIGLRYMDGFENLEHAQPESFQGDAKLSWRIGEGGSLSVVGRNLFDRREDVAPLKDSVGLATAQKREAYIEFRREF